MASEARGEDVAGSASTVPAFLLVEHAGPWGVDALRDARLPEGLAPRLRAHAHAARVRLLLIRRAGRAATAGHRVFAVQARPPHTWAETTTVADLHELLDLDLTALRAGSSVGLERHEQPLFAVCTQGRHDACCAERGRPVAAALASAFPEQTWEVSHIGGDRFAGNMMVAPDGLYYGRLDPASAIAVAEAQMRGELELDHLRGRSGYPMPVQAADIALRRELGVTSLDSPHFIGNQVAGDLTTATFEHGGVHYAVTVRTSTSGAAQLTCRATRPNPPISHEIEQIALA